MEIALSSAKAVLTDLARRAEHGETIVLTRHGRPVARIAPLEHEWGSANDDGRLARLKAIAARGRTVRLDEGFSSQEMMDEIYDEWGAPI